MKVQYLTKVELAALLRVTTRTIENYARTGALPKPFRLGRKALWPREATLRRIKLLAGEVQA